MLGVDPKTLHRRMQELGIVPGSSQDKRQRVISRIEFNRLADVVRQPTDGVSAELEQLRAEVAHLQLRVRALEIGVRTGMAQTIEASSTMRSEAPSVPMRSLGGLPERLVSLNAFCRLHGVNVTTIKDAITAGKLTCHRGNWKVGAARVEYALDEAEQAAVLAYNG